ncbi:carboxypeptidase-like regulatory domain-containing protein [Hymenobacter sp. DH14]|uniref:Carboxypeptidase-like regulatory domain-containing protein n=1 Tax=Hymenobacter cyanobacteriorum TaxID=2926463 RepID=A0A9X2AH01_9BACT|nr:carboxypeptidase-like regulatory domain-containing protein [Hymenobacter cyanobacteriorum]MCI1189382.1 carboxypeptidase-like regulatory domain-containing protein [Hymenobacter cyanobacteriorum]
MRFSSLLLATPALLLAFVGQAQVATVVTGSVLDARTQAAVPFASLAVPGQPGGTVTNQEGVFRLTLPAAGTDSIRVQALGYTSMTISAKGATAALLLKLQPQPYALQEVTVTALSPTTLLKRAVRQTTARMASPVELQTYYREFTTYNGEVAKFADGLVDYYIKGNPKRSRSPEVLVRVRESRAGEAPMRKDDARKAISSPLRLGYTGECYDVTQNSPYLDSTRFKYFRYTLLETPAGVAEAPYYEVRCTPISTDPDYVHQGTVRIDRQTLTIRLIESEVPTELQQYLRGINLLVVKVKGTNARQRVEFREQGGLLYPGFVRLQLSLDAFQGSSPAFKYEFTSEMLVRALGASPAPFAKAEQHSGPLFKRGTHYTRPYWREGNVVAATAAEEAAIKMLENTGAQ